MIIAEEITAFTGGRKHRFCTPNVLQNVVATSNPRKEKNVLIDCEARRRFSCGMQSVENQKFLAVLDRFSDGR